MPRLPTAEDFGQRPIPSVAPRGPTEVSGAPGEAIRSAGRQLMGLGDEFMRQEAIERDRADTMRAEESYNSLIERTMDLTEGDDGFRRKHGAQVANADLTGDYWGRYQQAQREIESTLGNDAQKAKFKARADVLGLQYRRDLLQHIGREGDVYRQQVYDRALDVEVRGAALHWDDKMAVAASVERLNAIINDKAEADEWDDDTLTLERAKALSGLHSSVVVSALDQNQLKYADDYFKQISPEVDEATRHQLSRAIDGKRREQEAERKQQQTLFRLELSETVQDVQAAYLAGGRYDGDIPTLADFSAAYGDDGAKRYDRFQRVLDVGSDIQEAALASPQEQAAILARNRPAPTAGFAEGQERYNILAGALSKINKEREDDPARFAITRLPGVANSFAAMSADPSNPALAEQYVNDVQAASAELKIQSPKVLPDDYAAQIVAGFYDQKEGGELAAMRILAEKERWGKAWPVVWSQISKDLPGAAFVIGAGMRPEAGRRLAEVALMKPEDLAKQLRGTKVGDINAAVDTQMSEALLSLGGQPGSDELGKTLVESTRLLAMRYVRDGKGADDAAKQAAAEVFNERYEFIESGDATIRVPRPYSGGDIKSALKIAKRDNAGVPRADEAQWQTLPNDAGVVLTWGGSVPNGMPVIAYTWDELLNRAATVGFSQGLPPDPSRRIR